MLCQCRIINWISDCNIRKNLTKTFSYYRTVYSPKHKLNNDYTVTTQTSSTVSQDWDATLEVPNTFGVGFTYNYDKRLTVGLDYSLQQWSKTKSGVNTSDDAVREDFDETYRIATVIGHQWVRNIFPI